MKYNSRTIKKLMFYTERILWFSNWLKRIAEAEIDVED